MCRKKKIKFYLGLHIVSFHMVLLRLGILNVVTNNWLLKFVPKLMGWKPITLSVEKPEDVSTDVQA